VESEELGIMMVPMVDIKEIKKKRSLQEDLSVLGKAWEHRKTLLLGLVDLWVRRDQTWGMLTSGSSAKQHVLDAELDFFDSEICRIRSDANMYWALAVLGEKGDIDLCWEKSEKGGWVCHLSTGEIFE
jgi:hypothetical protein